MTITEPVAPPQAGSRATWRTRLDRPGAVAAALGIAGLLYRAGLLAVDMPMTNSDEATMGLAALHIAEGRELPAFFYGQAYMGTLEAYLAVPLFWLIGPSTLALRLPNLLLYAGFVLGAYLLARRLYTPWLAVVTVAALALGADRVVRNQLISAGGYPEISPAGVLLLLLSVWLGEREERSEAESRSASRGRFSMGALRARWWVFAVWGFVAGLLFWDDWLILPYVAGAAAVLLVGLGRRVPVLAMAAGFVVGAAPLIVHNLAGPLRDNAVSVFLRQGGAEHSYPLGDHLYGGVLFGIPMGTGLCSPSRCAPWQMWWTVPYLLLLVAAAVLAVRGWRRAGDTGERVVEAARLSLVAAAALSIAAYARSGSSAETPVESARYLSCLLISLPAALWPLWALARHLHRRWLWADRSRSARAKRRGVGLVVGAALAAAPVAALLATMVFATAALVVEAPALSRRGREHLALADELQRQGISRVYADYWTCNRLVFATRERVICAVIADDLRPGYDRYRPYREQVAAADRPPYVLPTHLPLDAEVARRLTAAGILYETTTVAGYHIYRPMQKAPLPRAD